MPFKPGEGGRPKGALNKKTAVKSTIKQWFIDKNTHPIDLIMETIKEQKKLINQLDAADQIQAWASIRKGITDLLPYMVPRVKEEEDDGQTIDIAPEIKQAIQDAKPEDLLKLIHSIDNP